MLLVLQQILRFGKESERQCSLIAVLVSSNVLSIHSKNHVLTVSGKSAYDYIKSVAANEMQ